MNINIDTILQIAIPILTLIFGALSAYLKTNERLKDGSLKYIIEAEELYKDYTKAGGEKFSWVVDSLYKLIPTPLKIIFPKQCIEKIVQSSFDAIESYAKMQLDAVIEKYLKSDGKSGDLIDYLYEKRGMTND